MAKGDLRYRIDIAGEAATRYFELWTSDVKNQTKQLSDLIQKELGGPPIVQEFVVQTTTDENGVKRLKSELKEVGRITDQWNQALINVNKTQAGSVTSLRQQVNEAKQTRDAIAKIGRSADDLKNKVNSINPAWTEANNRVKQLSRELEIASASGFWQRLKAEFNLGPILNAGKAVNELVNTFQSLSIIVGQLTAPVVALSNALNDIQQIDLLFKGIGGGAAEVSKVFADSSDIALQYGVNLKTVREGFTQLTPVVLASGGSMDNVSSILDALSSRFATFGLSADKSKRVMNGVIQAFGKGKLMAEELTQQISEADPAFKTDLANAIGVTVAQLGEMVKAGEITTDVMLEMLPLLGKNSVYFGKLGTSATSAVAALGRGEATIEQVKNQLATLSQLNLEGLAQLFKPLLGAFLQVQAAAIDFVTELRQLESIKFVISVVNNLAATLATVVTAITNLAIGIGKFIDPIFAAVTAIDGFSKSLVGFEIIAGLVSVTLTAVLAKSLYTLAGSAIPQVLKGISALNTSFAILNGQAIVNMVKGFGNFIVSIASAIANIGKNIVANIALAASYKGVATAADAAALAKIREANAGNIASAAAAANIKAGKGVEAALEGVEAASGGAAKGFGVSARAAGVFALAMVPVAYAYNAYKQTSEAGQKAGKNFDEALKGIRAEFENFSGSAKNATSDTDRFLSELKRLSEEGRQRNDFEVVIDVVFMTDMNTAIAILSAKAELNKRFKSLQSDISGTRQRMNEYNAAQDAGSKKAQVLTAEVESQVKAYDALRQEALRTRNELMKRAASNGPLDPKEIIALKKFQEDIEKFTKARDQLVADAKAKGIKIDVELDTSGEEKVFTTVGSLQEELKSIKDNAAIATIGEQGTAETQQKIRALDGLLKFISEDPVIVKIKAEFDIDKAAIANQISYGEAMLNNVKSRASVEDSIFGVYKARNNYAISAAQEELKLMRDRGASVEAIQRKENEIATLKDNERKIEQNAIAVKLKNIGKEQALEVGVLELKQQGQRLEAQLAITTAERFAIEARIAQAIAEQNYLKAKQTKDPTDDEPARRMVELTRDYVELADQGVTAAKNRYNTLLATQGLEKDTLKNQQAAARNNLNAQAAQLGLNSKIDGGTTAYGQLNKEAVGFISAGGRTIQVYGEVGNALNGNLKSAEELNDELSRLPTDQSLDLTVSGTLDAQSINNAVSQGQRALNQPSNYLTAPLAPSVDTVSFVNEVKQAIAQVQSSDATRVTAQLSVNGQDMAAASIDSLTSAVSTYTSRVEIANQAQGQLQAAITEYNAALQSGDPSSIMTTAGALQYQREVVAAANFDLQNSKVALQDAQAIAQVLGVDIGTVGTQASVAAGEVSGIGQSMYDAAEQGSLLSQSADSVATSIADVDISAQNTAQNIATAGENLGQSWTTALQSAAGEVNGLQTDVGYVGQEVSNLTDQTGGLATGFSTADSTAGGLYNTTKAIVGELESDEAGTFAEYLGEASGNAEGVADSGFDSAAVNASDAGGSFDSSLQSASSQADEIYNTLSNIDSLSPTVEVNVIGTPGRFAGGPVDPGQMYRVNELGKEAFLSASGRLSMINKPRNGLWRAPSRGTVIPAHLTSNLDIPSGGVSLASGASARVSRAASGVSGVANMTRALAQALRASGLLETNSNVAVQQAGQAAQLGKLTHAVNKLADKDWNVHVNVKNPGASPYMDLMNRMS